MQWIHDDEAVCDFLIRLDEDLARGAVLPLAEYLRRFPGHDEAIARAYLARASRRGADHESRSDLSEAPSDEIRSVLSVERDGESRYLVENELARGGMGAVFKARDRDLECDLAMKVHLRSGSTSEHRFRREARLTARLSHPGVVPVHDLGRATDGRLYFTMRLVEGRTFRDAIDAVHARDPEWPLSRAIDVMIRVCETMAYAHSRGIVHRDLKPSNVMVGAFGEVYVVDWGVAGTTGSLGETDVMRRPDTDVVDPHDLLTLDGDVLGTPAYMAPEQASGNRADVGPAVDVYSAGALLYHLLTGHVPYARPGETTSSEIMLERVRRGDLAAIRSDLRTSPPELIAIQEKAMARERADRYPDMAAMARDLRAYVDLRVVSAYSDSTPRRIAKWVRRNRGLSVGIAIATTAALLALFVFVDQRAERTRVATLLSTQSTPTSVFQTFKDLWPIDASALPVLRRLVDDASGLLAHRAGLATERENTRARAQPIDLEAPAERAASRIATRAIASKQRLIAEFERLIAAFDAGQEKLPPAFSRQFYVEQIEFHRQEIVRLRTAPVSQVTFRFDDPLDQVLHDALTRLDNDFVRLEDSVERPGVLSVMRRAIERLEVAESKRPADLDASWATLRAELRDVNLAPAYGGFDLVPHPDLVPIGRDPDSGLYEFAHLLSGEIPTRTPEGRLMIDEGSAIVLVLIPPGQLMRGAQSESPEYPNYDPFEAKHEKPYAPIRITPFFFGKFEITQAQWQRLATRNPSINNPQLHADLGVTPMNPVEYVSFDDAAPIFACYGLAFPTEAQWEYAVRAGTSTTWFTGTEKESLVGYANVADQSAVKAGTCTRGRASWWKELDDGFAAHAPVNALLPNPFGLHGMLGNVAEWCKDGGPVDLDRTQEDVDDQERLGTPSGSRPVRGGSFALSYDETRSAGRRHAGPTRRDLDLGLRAARPIEP